MNIQKIKVSMIEPVGGHGGLELYDFGLCEAINRQGYEVVLYTCDQTKLDQLRNFQFLVEKVYREVFGGANRWLRGLRYVRGSIEALVSSIRFKSQVAHFHIYDFGLRELFNVVLFRLCGMRIAATVHDVERPDQVQSMRNKLTYRIFPFLIDRLIVHSQFTRNALLQVMPKAASRISVATHFDMDFVFSFSGGKQDARSFLGLELPDNAKVILFFGQIKETKGLDLLISAFARLQYDPAAYLLVAGRAWKSEMERYIRLIEDAGLSGRVILRSDYIPNEDVPVYFAAADMIALPYRKVYNSGVILRAMHYGTPVICSDLPPFLEVVNDGKTGLVFKSGDEEAFASALKHGMEHPIVMNDMSVNAKKLIDEKYSLDVVGREMNLIYQSLI